jgi:hypothetical protein
LHPDQPYPYYKMRLADVPLARLERPLNQARIALLDSAGVYRDDQPPFDADNALGDPSYRKVPVDTPPDRLGIAHLHHDHASAKLDLNSVYPVERLNALAAEGVIGASAPVALSFSGYITDAEYVVNQLGADFLREVRATGADGALLVPV